MQKSTKSAVAQKRRKSKRYDISISKDTFDEIFNGLLVSKNGRSFVRCRIMALQLLQEAENDPKAWRSMAPIWPWFGGGGV
jgi:hypothetical protein